MLSVRLFALLSLVVAFLEVTDSRKLSEQHPDTAFNEEEDPADPDDDRSMEDAFTKFKKKYGKRYKNKDHESNARANYKDSVKFVSAHNSLFADGVEHYTMKINEFSDISQAEFVEKYMGIKGDPDDRVVTRVAAAPREPRERKNHPESTQAKRKKRQEDPPASKDYRGYYITPIRSQVKLENILNVPEISGKLDNNINNPTYLKFQADSTCWAFAAAAALEGRTLLYYDLADSISEQNIIDCAFDNAAYANSGCEAGWSDYALNCIKAAGGVDGLKTYPYTGTTKGPCKYKAAAAIQNVAVADVTILESKDELEMMREVAWNGPVAVTVRVSDRFRNYGSGGRVFDDPDCADNAKAPGLHAVTIVGYGTDEVTGWDYWLIRNSWGTSWGDKGYMKFRRNNDNMCSVGNFVVGPVIP